MCGGPWQAVLLFIWVFEIFFITMISDNNIETRNPFIEPSLVLQTLKIPIIHDVQLKTHLEETAYEVFEFGPEWYDQIRSSGKLINLTETMKLHEDINNHPLIEKVKGMNFKEMVKELKLTRDLKTLDEVERGAMVKVVTEFAIKEPLVEIEETCEPILAASIKCEDYGENLNGERERPARIGHLIQFGFEADSLEIHLHEIYDYIDKFFIVEAQRTHFMNTPKPLIWPQLAKQKRFSKFLDKIVYFVITDELIENHAQSSVTNIWRNEGIQEDLRWRMFLEWNKKHDNYFKEDDVLGFGDTDEISSRHNLALIKKCNLKGVTDIGIWFTFGTVSKYHNSCFHVRGHYDNLGDPTYWPVKAAMDNSEKPSRNRGKSPYHLLGGLHLTRYRYIPHVLAKELSATEAGNTNHPIFQLLDQLSNSDVSLHEMKLQMMKYIDKWSVIRDYFDMPKDRLGTLPFVIP
ncbi:putative beta-1,4-mannosyl-glycoprotein beta-1,4-N-acetylglucosaminyltransferase [Tritrichomonas foetus]|uniref:Beta-1,4-mannosyl-glycoprotein beta-1,4-N-acetylglucosaminyltransferase n=1 Tax=Tritrichomonas foetus TaxID=1144522 RepID=A0A1J4JT45_9EUKA|nr:putative beta-1,4-mannosyl-glycoprotein beta-1,4-N-acetylglucosaminyltransferase [Tritrichomonas foetus]|eukprot:OHT01914.1 putative beta-1,4-mannosyl-glycoprotein beta-1,4-N-acetylglucosaminyltransferase [Tritrichomonas foetus]